MTRVTVSTAGESTTVDYTPPVQDRPAMLVGTTKRFMDPDVPTFRAQWNIMHTYDLSDALKIPASMVLAHTFTSVLGGPDWSKTAANVTRARQNLGALPDRPNIWVNDLHEPEDNYGWTVSGGQRYAADAAVFGQLVADANQTRSNPFRWFQQFQGGSLVGSHNPDDMIPWCVPTADAVGFDVYGPNQADASIAFARKIGKPLCIPEMGPLTNVPKNDPAMYAYTTAALPKFQAAGVLWLTWFDKKGAGADLDAYPNTSAYLQSQIAT